MYRPYCVLYFEADCIFCDLQAEAEEKADDVNITLEFLSIANFTKSRSLRDIDYYRLFFVICKIQRSIAVCVIPDDVTHCSSPRLAVL